MVDPITFSSRTKKVLAKAAEEARQSGQRLIEPEHLLIGIMAEGRNLANEALVACHVTAPTVRQAFTHIRVSRAYRHADVR